MKASACWGLLAAAAMAAPACAEEAHCQLQSLGEMAVTVQKNGEITTSGEVDGKPVRLIVDTGAFGTLLFENEARSLGLFLRETGAKAYGVGGESDVYRASVKEFRLGDLVERNVDLVVSGRSLEGAQGLVGAKFLLQADVEFDLPHGKIRFFKPKGCDGDQVVYWGEAYAQAPLLETTADEILTEVTVNDKRLVAKLDTGSAVSFLTPEAATAASLPLKVTSATGDNQVTGLGPHRVAQYADVFPTFSFGDETIRNATLRVADLFGRDKEKQINDLIATPVANEPRMLLGADFFRAHRVFVVREQHKIYVSYQGGPVFQPPPSAQAQVDHER
jgi:clan AA aspartic protease (TIGR02281 family)